jgi:hypothetical protein
MNFLMGKGYWEFITSDEKEPPLLENPTKQQIKPIILGMKKLRKFCIGFYECV